MEADSDDQVHWKIVETSDMSISDFNVTLSNIVADKVAQLLHTVIMNQVQSLIKSLPEMVNSEVDKINDLIANAGPYTFDVSVGGMPLNLTMTKAPELQPNSDILRLNFDGLFNKKENATLGENRFILGHSYFPNMSPLDGEQIWIHQDTFNSALRDMKDFNLLPQTVPLTDDLLTSFEAVFPVIPQRYGKDVKMALSISVNATDDQPLITFSKLYGIHAGSKKNLVVDLTVLCSNETVKDDAPIRFLLTTVAQLDLNMTDAVLMPKINVISVINAQSMSKIKIDAKNYTGLFTAVLNDQATKINAEYRKGIALTRLIPSYASLIDKFEQIKLSVRHAEEWLFFGFQVKGTQSDKVAERSQELHFLSN